MSSASDPATFLSLTIRSAGSEHKTQDVRTRRTVARAATAPALSTPAGVSLSRPRSRASSNSDRRAAAPARDTSGPPRHPSRRRLPPSRRARLLMCPRAAARTRTSSAPAGWRVASWVDNAAGAGTPGRADRRAAQKTIMTVSMIPTTNFIAFSRTGQRGPHRDPDTSDYEHGDQCRHGGEEDVLLVGPEREREKATSRPSSTTRFNDREGVPVSDIPERPAGAAARAAASSAA